LKWSKNNQRTRVLRSSSFGQHCDFFSARFARISFQVGNCFPILYQFRVKGAAKTLALGRNLGPSGQMRKFWRHSVWRTKI